MKILVTRPLPDWALAELKALGHKVTTVSPHEYIEEADFIEGIKGYEVYVSGGLEECTAPVIEAADKLKTIIFLGRNYKSYINVAAAKAKGIPVLHTPGATARAVAELTLMLMLMAARRAALMLHNMENQVWHAKQGFELHGKTLGLLGSGAIAREVATIGLNLGMQVLYYSRGGPRPEMPATFTSFEDVLARAHILSLHKSTAHGMLLNDAAFALMQNCRVLVNTGRAVTVDPEALHKALTNGPLQTAAFDVFYAEGANAFTFHKTKKLLELGPDKFFLTPHAGWNTREGATNILQAAIAHIKTLG